MDKQSILNRLFSGSKQLPTMPEMYSKFAKAIENQQASGKTIADLIMKDQSMVTKILKMSNSAMYGLRQEITNLSAAVTLLGIETLKNLVLQVSLVREFKFDNEEVPEFKIGTFWEHSLSTAFFADVISGKLKLPKNENYYLGGLLHDIGKLVIYQYYPEKFKDIILMQIDTNCCDYEAEEKIIGVTHSDVGAFFAEKWNFKKEIIDILDSHHKTLISQGTATAVVRLANLFSKAAGMCFPWDNKLLEIVSDPTWEILSNYTTGSFDFERFVDEIMNESNKIKDSVRELLTSNSGAKK
jgi:putative nucleotidyltransferase with HDIG domain